MYKKLLVIGVAAFALTSCGSETENTTETNSEVEVSETKVESETSEETAEVDANDLSKASNRLFEEAPYLAFGQNRDFDPSSWISIDSLSNQISTSGAANEVVVKGNIDEVCQKAGCWITMKDAEGNAIRMRFKDHFTIPIEGTAGKEVFVSGTGVMDTTSIDMLKHYLEDAKEAGQEVTQEEIDAITEPKIEPSFEADGIMILEK